VARPEPRGRSCGWHLPRRPHPGNLVLTGDGTGDGRVALFDCGSIGRLDRRQRSALQAALLERALGDVVAQHLNPGMPLGGALRALATLQSTFELIAPDLDPLLGRAATSRNVQIGRCRRACWRTPQAWATNVDEICSGKSAVTAQRSWR